MLQRILQSYSLQSQVFIIAWMIALLFSMEFILSLSMIGLLGIALVEKSEGRWNWRKGLGNQWRQFFRSKDWMIIMLPFFLVVGTAIYSTEDSPYLIERLRIKLPYLILPFAFFSMPRLSQRTYQQLLYIFLLLVTAASIGVLVHYGWHYEAINEGMRKGQPIPTPTSHIRFSLMISLSILLGISLYRRHHYWRYRWERYLILGVSAFLFIFLHILSVRSGLLVFYIAFGALLLRNMWLHRQYLRGVLAILALCILPVVAYYSLASFKNKVDYTVWDMKMYLSGQGESYSDSERIHSLVVAQSLIASSPIWGVGAGDVRHDMKAQYAVVYPELTAASHKMPHNQLVSIWLGTGLVGLCCFLLGGMYPLFAQKRYLDPHFLAINLIVLFSFMVENTIENAIGIGFHLLFLLIGMNYLKK